MHPHHIAVLGGTGPQGRGLALRFAAAGHSVTIGSRDAERAVAAARLLEERLPGASVAAASNVAAAAAAEVVLIAVPWGSHVALVDEVAGHLAGKVVITCANPLGFDERGPYGLPLERSAAEETQARVPDARVVGAFHHVSARLLWEEPEATSADHVLVCGDDDGAKALVVSLARAVTGSAGVDAGALRMARLLEPFTAVLISVNKRYGTHSGLALTGVADRG